MCVLHHDWWNTTVALGIATWTKAATLNLCLTQVPPFCGLLYSWHVKDIMRKTTKLKGKIYKHRLSALTVSVPEDFELKWISPSKILIVHMQMPSTWTPVGTMTWLCKSDGSEVQAFIYGTGLRGEVQNRKQLQIGTSYRHRGRTSVVHSCREVLKSKCSMERMPSLEPEFKSRPWQLQLCNLGKIT